MRPESKNLKFLRKWEAHKENIKRCTSGEVHETPEEKKKRITRLLGDYGAFFQYYFPHYAKSPCAWFHKDAAKRILANQQIEMVAEWGRGLAKSIHFTIGIPAWLKAQKVRELNTMVLVGRNETAAKRLLADLQAEFEENQKYLADFGPQFKFGHWETGDFTTTDGCSFIALGMGQPPRGTRVGAFRPDYIVSDDLDDDKMVKNPSRVDDAVEWILRALLPTMDEGIARYIHVNNRISKYGILAKLVESGKFTHHKVNALNKHGEPEWPEKHSKAYYTRLELRDYAAFQTEYMNNPISKGKKFKQEWIQWKAPLKLKKYVTLICYCDPSYKSSSTSDFKAVKLWGKTADGELHLLWAFVRQCTITEMVKAHYDLAELIPSEVVVSHYVEGGFMQDELIWPEYRREGKERGWTLPLISDKRKKPEKVARIINMIPLYQRGLIFYNIQEKSNPDMVTAVDHLLMFDMGSGTPDDSPDADEGAIFYCEQRTSNDEFKPRFGRRASSNRF